MRALSSSTDGSYSWSLLTLPYDAYSHRCSDAVECVLYISLVFIDAYQKTDGWISGRALDAVPHGVAAPAFSCTFLYVVERFFDGFAIGDELDMMCPWNQSKNCWKVIFSTKLVEFLLLSSSLAGTNYKK